MGAINFGPKALADRLSETAGYKTGLALSIEEICDHLSSTSYPDIIIDSEESGARIRAEEYEDLFDTLLHRIGYLDRAYFGMHYESGQLFSTGPLSARNFAFSASVAADRKLTL